MASDVLTTIFAKLHHIPSCKRLAVSEVISISKTYYMSYPLFFGAMLLVQMQRSFSDMAILSMMLLIQMSRAHVLRDLKPYVCTYPGCHQPDLLFNSRHDWIEHERWEHRKVWTCPEHPGQTFRVAEDFHRHFEEQPHKISSELSFTALRDISQTADLDSRRNCPVCLALFATAEQLQNHVASHLERFAAFALPRDVDTVDDDNELSRGSKNSSGGVHASTHDWQNPQMLSVDEKMLLIQMTITQVAAFNDGLEVVNASKKLPQETKDYMDQFKNATFAIVTVLHCLQGYNDYHIQSKEHTEAFDEVISSLQRLQNLLNSVRIEVLFDHDSQDRDEIKEKLESEARILSRILTLARDLRTVPCGSWVRALYDFSPTELGELAFRKGEIITVLESVYLDWSKGSLRGRIGIFPLNYVEELKHEADREREIYEQIPYAEKLSVYSHLSKDKPCGAEEQDMAVSPGSNSFTPQSLTSVVIAQDPAFNTSHYHRHHSQVCTETRFVTLG